MPKSTIDTMIEEWASSLGASTRVSPDQAAADIEKTAVTQPKPSKSPKPTSVEPPAKRPENWDPMGWLLCGHPTYQMVEDEKGHRVTRRIREPGPASCPACAAGKKGNPIHQVGDWCQPVPERDQRNSQRSAANYPGWSGLCTDPTTGFYIGGLGNDCRYYHDGPVRCTFHQRKQST